MTAKNGNGRSVAKTRNWAGIIYPESAPSDWRNRLADLKMKALLSPLHDRDVDEGGSPKKAHHHLILIFDGPVSQKVANEVLDQVGCGTKSAEYIRSLSSYARYLAHLDHPEKAQYDPRGIVAYGGVDLARLLAGGEESKVGVYSEITDFCEEQGITSFSVLVRYARERRKEWFPVIVSKAYFFRTYLQSLDFDSRDGSRRR